LPSREYASKIAGKQRIPRALFSPEDAAASEDGGPSNKLLTPEETRKLLLRSFQEQHQWEAESSYLMRNSASGHDASSSDTNKRTGRSRKTEKDADSSVKNGGCVPSRLCESSYNTTAPMYGISLTSGQPVTIVQKFPDLLQQVVYQVCTSEECDVVQGQCVQTYLPYLFLVIPLGPVTLTGKSIIIKSKSVNYFLLSLTITLYSFQAKITSSLKADVSADQNMQRKWMIHHHSLSSNPTINPSLEQTNAFS
jgi:hypothetical protein